MADYSESEFQGKVAVITGAGNGLGRSHAHEFAKRGNFSRVVTSPWTRDDCLCGYLVDVQGSCGDPHRGCRWGDLWMELRRQRSS